VRSRVLRIAVPFVVGWFILRPLVVSGWIMGSASLRGDVDVWAGLLGGFQSFSTLPAGIFAGSHLWFLYYLAMITALTLALRGLVTATGSWQAVLVRRADALDLHRLGAEWSSPRPGDGFLGSQQHPSPAERQTIEIIEAPRSALNSSYPNAIAGFRLRG